MGFAFFFQAEDGIRDGTVTGVQTCALPIFSERLDRVAESPELTALSRNVQGTFSRIVEAVPYLPEELQYAVANIDDPSALSHLIAGSLRLKTEEKQGLLEETDVVERLRALVQILARELEVISIGS